MLSVSIPSADSAAYCSGGHRRLPMMMSVSNCSDGPNSRVQLFTEPSVSRFIGESRRPCHEIWKDLISRGASTTRTPATGAVIVGNWRGTVRIKSVCAMAKIAGLPMTQRLVNRFIKKVQDFGVDSVGFFNWHRMICAWNDGFVASWNGLGQLVRVLALN